MTKLRTEFVAAWNDWAGNFCVSLDDYDKLSDELASVKEQLAAAKERAEDAERDAKRYRWLRESNLDKDRVQVSAVKIYWNEYWLEELDQEIDEAMKQNG